MKGSIWANEGAEGLITYMRTDSVRIAPEAIDAVRKYIAKEFGKEYLPAEGQAVRLEKKRPRGPRSDPPHQP